MSQNSDIGLMIVDVDGTLVTPDKILTEDTKFAVHRLHEVGIAVAITSGRPPKGMRMLIEPLALRTPIAAFNGGMFVNPDLSVIESHCLSAEAAIKAVRLILDHGLDIWVYTNDDWFIRDPDAPHVLREAWTVKFAPQVVPRFGSEHLEHAIKIVGISDDLDRVAVCTKLVQGELGGQVSAARSQPYYLDVTNPRANKGTVLATLSKRLNIPPERVATIGDMPSDVLMFRKSGLSIAMGNASDQVKREADLVTDSNSNEGFAKAVQKLLLGSDSDA